MKKVKINKSERSDSVATGSTDWYPVFCVLEEKKKFAQGPIARTFSFLTSSKKKPQHKYPEANVSQVHFLRPKYDWQTIYEENQLLLGASPNMTPLHSPFGKSRVMPLNQAQKNQESEGLMHYLGSTRNSAQSVEGQREKCGFAFYGKKCIGGSFSPSYDSPLPTDASSTAYGSPTNPGGDRAQDRLYYSDDRDYYPYLMRRTPPGFDRGGAAAQSPLIDVSPYEQNSSKIGCYEAMTRRNKIQHATTVPFDQTPTSGDFRCRPNAAEYHRNSGPFANGRRFNFPKVDVSPTEDSTPYDPYQQLCRPATRSPAQESYVSDLDASWPGPSTHHLMPVVDYGSASPDWLASHSTAVANYTARFAPGDPDSESVVYSGGVVADDTPCDSESNVSIFDPSRHFESSPRVQTELWRNRSQVVPTTGQPSPRRQPPVVIRAQPGNVPLSDSEQEDWC
uniref:Uncharacterized protein n=1 Tax=Romanomermis culicivorax TaxID=13658 RepID=A0A915L329_ROMCU